MGIYYLVLNKMKTILFIVLLSLYGVANSTITCAAANYCMGCSSSTADVCTSCFNWGSGSVGARYLSSNTCTNKLSTSKVTDCKYYTGNQSSDTASYYNCLACNKDFRNNNANTNTMTCSNTAANTTTCTGKVSDC